MRFFVSLIVATFALTGAALADPFANFYGNTVSIEGSEGTRTVHVMDDGTYHQTMADGTSVTSTWVIDGDNACFVTGEDTPPYCVPAVARNVGDTWEMVTPDGETETATLVEGM